MIEAQGWLGAGSLDKGLWMAALAMWQPEPVGRTPSSVQYVIFWNVSHGVYHQIYTHIIPHNDITTVTKP